MSTPEVRDRRPPPSGCLPVGRRLLLLAASTDQRPAIRCGHVWQRRRQGAACRIRCERGHTRAVARHRRARPGRRPAPLHAAATCAAARRRCATQAPAAGDTPGAGWQATATQRTAPPSSPRTATRDPGCGRHVQRAMGDPPSAPSLLRRPGCLRRDPWLCVPASRRVCPFVGSRHRQASPSTVAKRLSSRHETRTRRDDDLPGERRDGGRIRTALHARAAPAGCG